MTVIQVHAEAAHKSRLDDFASYEAAEQDVAEFLRDVVDKIWYNNLEDADLFTQRSRPSTSCPSSTPTAEGYMPST